MGGSYTARISLSVWETPIEQHYEICTEHCKQRSQSSPCRRSDCDNRRLNIVPPAIIHRVIADPMDDATHVQSGRISTDSPGRDEHPRNYVGVWPSPGHRAQNAGLPRRLWGLPSDGSPTHRGLVLDSLQRRSRRPRVERRAIFTHHRLAQFQRAQAAIHYLVSVPSQSHPQEFGDNHRCSHCADKGRPNSPPSQRSDPTIVEPVLG